jgi:lipopolysaccharide export LptBFGC system permease protein LptF
MAKDKNYVPVWFWMLAMLVMALPCVGLIMENESRKNYFRALLLWFLIGFGMWAVMMMLGYWPELQKHVQNWLHRIP